VQGSLRKIVKCLSANQLAAEELEKVMEIFCGNFVELMIPLDAETLQKSFISLLSSLAAVEDEVAEKFAGFLSEAVFACGSSALHNAYSSALSDSLDSKDSRLNEIAVKAGFRAQPAAMSREKRETVLDQLARLSSAGSSDMVGSLGVMVSLMEVPNASAKISTDGAVLFDIAGQLQKRGSQSRSVLQSLQLLSQRTLGHIIPNQTQAQSRAFLGEYQKRLNSMTQGTKTIPPVGLAILRATVLEQKDAQLLSVKQYVTLLKKCLTEDGDDVDSTASFEDVLDAFDELFPALLVDATLLKATTAWLRTWIQDNADLESFMVSSNSVSVEVAEYVARLHKLMAKYKLYPDVQWLVTLTARVLRESISDMLERSLLSTVTEALMPLEVGEKLALVPHTRQTHLDTTR
jgi:nucleolar pre-ribosomal-associated protein 2